ncbi:NTPase KAP family P-loop domain-containing protein 1-like [Dendropsophus ebraccatus]|uniref:NTPase KAP family P-loop domain-containing protein 1-like n=1 Tax=Dendropsophus ebraccatus TaxID=150705 RepID=UPI003831FEEB
MKIGHNDAELIQLYISVSPNEITDTSSMFCETWKLLSGRHNIFIDFNAWHCTSCDYLWAGLVTALCDGIEDAFGLIPIGIYRALKKNEESDGDEAEENKHNKSKKCKILHIKEWAPKKILHIPVLIVTLFVFLFLVCSLLVKFLLNVEASDQYDSVTDYILYTAVTIFGGSSVLLSRSALKVVRNLIVTQKDILMQKMKRTDMSSQLGFMSDVKKEINIITSYLQMMEIYRKQEIRVIIEITKLDKCLPDRVVEVLHAINVLLSNKDAPFICILAVDPGIITECAEKSDLLKGMANNGYLFLNRIVTLPFSVPEMNDKTKELFLKRIIKEKDKSDHPESIENQDTTRDPTQEAEELINSPEYRQYINDNVINMRRIVNTIIITRRLMIEDDKCLSTHKVLKWVIMAAQWPCTLSWILQCIEDELQSIRKKKKQDSPDSEKDYLDTKLLLIYNMSLDALNANRESIKQLLELDGDLDVFCQLLKKTKFTVEDAIMLRPYTVNLDPTIQRKIELLHDSFNLLRFKKETLSRMDLMKMDTEAVCKKILELENISAQYLNEYVKNIRDHNLNGKAILYTDNVKIREALDMNLGDWVAFRDVFLSLPTPNLLL